MAYLNELLTGHTITDEVINRASSTASPLAHSTIRVIADVAIWTGSGGTGTKLTLTTDYVISAEDTVLSAKAGVSIYTKLAIVNGTYQNIPLYVSYKTIGDYTNADEINNISGTETVTTSGTIPSNSAIILINTNSAISLTIPSGAKIGKTYTFTRISSGLTANAVTLTLTGETIFGNATLAIFGNTNAKTIKYVETFTIMKLTSTTWTLSAGIDSGASAGGSWEKLFSGKALQKGVSGNITSSTGGNPYFGTASITFPFTFISVSRANASNLTNTAGIAWCGYTGSLATTGFVLYRMAFVSGDVGNCAWEAEGRWI